MPRKSSAAIAFATDTTARIRPPDDLTGPARDVFLDLVCACRASHFTGSDIPLLCSYSRAIVLERTASAGLAADGHVTADGRPSGWLGILAQATRTMSTLARALRLSPASRQSVPSSEPELVSAYERMSLEGRREPEPS